MRETSLDGSRRDVATVDAVAIVPGIMGSTLDVVGPRGNSPVWGVGSAVKNAARWRDEARIDALRVREDELGGHGGRVVPTGLLALPEWMRGFGGIEPYKRLIKTVSETVLDPAAVFLFAYDWRLDVEHNARILARETCAHLERWRRHEALRTALSRSNDDREPRIVFVAHSMGGLLVRAMSSLPVEQPETRAVVTLGTPFAGSVKTMSMLAEGEGAPLGMSRAATRQACLSMPGVYDLLPWYRCRLKDDDVVVLEARDVTGVGAPDHLVQAAFARRRRAAESELSQHHAVVGVGQVTAQSLELDGTHLVTHDWGFRRNQRGELVRESGRLVTHDHDGDGTVFRYSARTRTVEGIAVAQHHQSLAVARPSLRIVRKVITEADDLDTVLGQNIEEAPLGLEVPDEAAIDQPVEIRIRSAHTPADITCAMEDTARRDLVVRHSTVRGPAEDGAFVVRVDVDTPGLYRVRVAAGSTEVTKLVMIGTP
jgi:hypothetical protein